MVKSRTSFGLKIFVVAILFSFAAIVSFYITDRSYKAHFKCYTDFGIYLPENYSIHGIDVSRYQKEISWQDVKEMKVKNTAIGFAFIKATEGIDRTDEQFINNMTAAKEAGIKRGAYHFFIPGESGRLQAENFIKTAPLTTGDLPPVLDAERIDTSSIPEVQLQIAEWLSAVEKRYHTKPIIYSNIDFYNTVLAGKSDNYPLWIAHYYAKDKPRIKRNWAFWQHNERGTVNGIKAPVDFNVFNGDSTAFQQLLMK